MTMATLEQYKESASFAQLNGHSIAYWQSTLPAEQDAQTLVFIHGFPSAAWDWHAQWDYFKGDYNLVACDLLGFGLSDKPHPHAYSVIEQAQIVSGLCAQLGIEKAHVVAHDYGDSVAQELLAMQVEGKGLFYIQSLSWLNGGLFPEVHRPLLTQKLLHSPLGPLLSRLMTRATLSKSFTKIFGANTPPSEHTIDTLWALMEHNSGTRVIPKVLDYLDERRQYRDRWLSAMKATANEKVVPLQFVNGVLDPISGGHMLDHFRVLLPGVHTVALDVGHYPQLEDAMAVNEAIAQLISE